MNQPPIVEDDALTRLKTMGELNGGLIEEFRENLSGDEISA